jgi:hypothetical protein
MFREHLMIGPPRQPAVPADGRRPGCSRGRLDPASSAAPVRQARFGCSIIRFPSLVEAAGAGAS